MLQLRRLPGVLPPLQLHEIVNVMRPAVIQANNYTPFKVTWLQHDEHNPWNPWEEYICLDECRTHGINYLIAQLQRCHHSLLADQLQEVLKAELDQSTHQVKDGASWAA